MDENDHKVRMSFAFMVMLYFILLSQCAQTGAASRQLRALERIANAVEAKR